MGSSPSLGCTVSKLLIQAPTWMNLRNILRRERNQTKKSKELFYSLI